MSKKLLFQEAEVVEHDRSRLKRYPNLNTVLMVEDFLKQHRDMPMKVAEMKKQLPKQIMHQTLIVILDYLWRSGKIVFGPRGVQWIYAEPEHLRKMLSNAVEV